MKDEIKEILEDYGCIPKIKKLGDYITNLEQENGRLNKEISRIMEIIDLNAYNYGYQIEEEITGGDSNE